MTIAQGPCTCRVSLLRHVRHESPHTLAAITTGALFFAVLFLLPETLYIRLPNVEHTMTANHHPMRTAVFSRPHRAEGRHITGQSFWQPIYMARYVVIIATAFYYSVAVRTTHLACRLD
jgi:hypothetical protein